MGSSTCQLTLLPKHIHHLKTTCSITVLMFTKKMGDFTNWELVMEFSHQTIQEFSIGRCCNSSEWIMFVLMAQIQNTVVIV
jgi:hypothetical protein